MNRNLADALADLRSGRPIVVVDSWDRENEGDIVIAAQHAGYQNINFTCRFARGLMCLPSEGSVLDRLAIPMMVEQSTDRLSTPFTVSVDARYGVETGVSVSDRLKTIEVFMDPDAKPDDLSRPGHLFPLRARAGGLGERQGHTEASVTLMKMAKLHPVAVISEIMNEDGTMARMPDLITFANKHDLLILTIEEIIEEVNRTASIVGQIEVRTEPDDRSADKKAQRDAELPYERRSTSTE